MWKFQDLSVIQILREINFGEFKSTKYAILTHLEAMTFDFYAFLRYLKAEIYQINKINSFRTSRFSKIDFMKNLNDRKSLKFAHCEKSHCCAKFCKLHNVS